MSEDKSVSREDALLEEFQKLFEFKSPEDKINHDAFMIAARFLSEVERLWEESGERSAKRTGLAKEVGTSKSYITQIFRGDKLPNFKLLAKIQEALDIRFEVVAVAPMQSIHTELTTLREANKSLVEENERLKEGLRNLAEKSREALETSRDNEGYEPIMDAAFDSIHAAEKLLNPISQNKNTKE